VARAAIALVEAHRGRFVCGVAESGGREGQEDDVARVAAVAGTVVGAAGWWGGGAVGGVC